MHVGNGQSFRQNETTIRYKSKLILFQSHVDKIGSPFQKEDWRPRRSLIFCSWGAEEYGLIGSYEWVEEHAKVLSQRAVAYLNVDIAVEGECGVA